MEDELPLYELQRINRINQDPYLLDAINRKSLIYGLQPSTLAYRLGHEGFIDELLRGTRYNNQGLPIGVNRITLLGKHTEPLNNYLYNPASAYAGVLGFGLDDGATMLQLKDLLRDNEAWEDMEFENEKGRTTFSASGLTNKDNIGITASLLSEFKDLAEQDFPNASDKLLELYALIYFNRGRKGGRDYINSNRNNLGYNADSYKVKETVLPSFMTALKLNKEEYLKLKQHEALRTVNEAISNRMFDYTPDKMKLYNEKASGGNLYKGGSWLDSIKDYFSPTIKATGRSNVTLTRDKDGFKVNGKTPIEGYKFYDRSTGKQYVYRNGRFIIDTGRRHNNLSPTAERSLNIEDKMETILYNRLKGKPNDKYYIPYNDNDEVNGVSRNMLDSVAKYAGQAGTPIVEGLGLALHETKFGRTPWFNTKKGDTEWNRSLLNTNYAKNKGGIPAEYLVRDYNYNGGVYNDAPILDRNTSPLLHAFLYFNSGRYNTEQSNHTYDVRRDGLLFFNNKEVQDWWNREGQYWYDGTYRNINDETRINLPLQNDMNLLMSESLGVPIELPNPFAHLLYNKTNRQYGSYPTLLVRPETQK